MEVGKRCFAKDWLLMKRKALKPWKIVVEISGGITEGFGYILHIGVLEGVKLLFRV